GHDNYMYLVAKENGTTLPPTALFIIQYHSFYPLHKSGAYTHLMNADDVENLKWLKIFNKYDFYSKSKVRIDVEKVKPYCLSLIEKYFPAKLRWSTFQIEDIDLRNHRFYFIFLFVIDSCTCIKHNGDLGVLCKSSDVF
ncbi:probable inositol oxygenase, partial [Camellia sinensis]|uniref:probable inositol oxygenase n=1 Tax=Camellia sinensis TaxID=4442 RepID=UPI00103620A6